MSNGFKAPEWSHATNIYEVNVRQFTPEGTFNAFAAALPRLKDMGVETLWFMPIQPVGLKNRKGTLGSYYSIRDYSSVNPEFGTIDDFKSLVKEAHKQGFRVIIDWVANHTSWDHVWTTMHPEFYSTDANGNFRPPFPDWADVLDLNYQHKELTTAMIREMKYWVDETGIDGFRCDMAHLVPLDFWIQARTELDTIRPLFWLAETEEALYHRAFDASYTWEFLHKMEQYWRKETDISGLDSILTKYADTVFAPSAIRMFFTSNHDENSHSGTEFDRMGDAAKPFAVLCATLNGIPLLYSGQELPLRKKIAFFEKDPIPWSGTNEFHDFYKKLLTLHSSHPALRAADSTTTTTRLHQNDAQGVFAFIRKSGEKEVLVVLNLSDKAIAALNVVDAAVKGKFTELFTEELWDANSEKKMSINGWGYKVFVKMQ